MGRRSAIKTDDESNSSDGSDGDLTERNAGEVEIEKVVFGDDVGFRKGIRSHALESLSSASKNEERHEEDDGRQTEEADLGALDDSELFFLDTEPVLPAEKALIPSQAEDDENDGLSGKELPAWEDSDDERIMVSLATNTRLRKLRNYEDEDLINGKEYTKRLRRQFERLNPIPEWVQYARDHNDHHKGLPRKKRRGSDSNGSSAEDMDVDEEELAAQPLAKLLQNPDAFISRTDDSSTKRRKLRPEVLDIQRTRDVGGPQPSAITSLSFHPLYPVILSSGPASTLYLHRISPSDSVNPNPLLTSLHIRHTPLTTTAFHPPHGSRIFFSGRRRYFHIWDLPSGAIEKVTRVSGHQEEQRDMERFKLSPCGCWMGLVGTRRKADVGVVNILNAKTSQWTAEARIESRGGIADFAWWRDGKGLSIASKAGEVIEYNLHQRRTVARWTDEGSVGTTVLALGGNISRHGQRRHQHQEGKEDEDSVGSDRWVAIGSSSGIVNLYDRKGWNSTTIPHQPTPIKVLGNLTTPISHLIFSPDAQLLAMSSGWKRDALRLVHVPTCTVYKNWPTTATPLGRITAVAFSSDSAMLAVGNEQGKLRLWEIRG